MTALQLPKMSENEVVSSFSPTPKKSGEKVIFSFSHRKTPEKSGKMAIVRFSHLATLQLGLCRKSQSPLFPSDNCDNPEYDRSSVSFLATLLVINLIDSYWLWNSAPVFSTVESDSQLGLLPTNNLGLLCISRWQNRQKSMQCSLYWCERCREASFNAELTFRRPFSRNFIACLPFSKLVIRLDGKYQVHCIRLSHCSVLQVICIVIRYASSWLTSIWPVQFFKCVCVIKVWDLVLSLVWP